MVLHLTRDKVTKNGIVRYSDGNGHNIYLTPTEVAELGAPAIIHVTIASE